MTIAVPALNLLTSFGCVAFIDLSISNLHSGGVERSASLSLCLYSEPIDARAHGICIVFKP